MASRRGLGAGGSQTSDSIRRRKVRERSDAPLRTVKCSHWRKREGDGSQPSNRMVTRARFGSRLACGRRLVARSEEHTSELQSRLHLVCRLLLEKKKKKDKTSSC